MISGIRSVRIVTPLVLLVSLLSACQTSESLGPTQSSDVHLPESSSNAVSPNEGTRDLSPRTSAIEQYRQKHQVIGERLFSLPGMAPMKAHFVLENGLIGVVVSRQGELTELRPFSPKAGGLVGPDSDPELWVADLDLDGTTEIVLEGLSSPHTRGLWVYHFDPTAHMFKFMDFLAGDGGIEVERQQSGPPRFLVQQRDLTKPPVSTVTHLYQWENERFVEKSQLEPVVLTRDDLPQLVSYSVQYEKKDGEVHILPNPTKLKADVTGTDKVIWRVVSSSGRDLQWLIQEPGRPGPWEVEWGNPNPPPPTPVSLVLMAKIAPELPDPPSFKRMGNDRFVELVRLTVKGW